MAWGDKLWGTEQTQHGFSGWGCSSVGRVSDWHAAEAGSIPQCSKGFFSQSQLFFRRLSYGVCTCVNICVCIKGPVVRVKVLSIMETLKHPSCTVGWVARLFTAGFPHREQPNSWEKSQWDNTVAPPKKNNNNKQTTTNKKYTVQRIRDNATLQFLLACYCSHGKLVGAIFSPVL